MKKVALIIGHSETSQGAINEKQQISEFMFNELLAMLIADNLTRMGQMVCVVYRDGTYRELIETVNLTDAYIAVSLHCNAFDKNPHGTETLYYQGSENGKLLAQSMQDSIVKCLGLKDRGLKPCDYDHVGKKGDRGGYLLKKTKMPCVIVEPFFIDSDCSLDLAHERINELSLAYCEGIINYLK